MEDPLQLSYKGQLFVPSCLLPVRPRRTCMKVATTNAHPIHSAESEPPKVRPVLGLILLLPRALAKV